MDTAPGYMDCLIKQATKIRLLPRNLIRERGFKFSQSCCLVSNMITNTKPNQSEDRNRINKLMTAHLHSIGLSSVSITDHMVIYRWDGLNLVLHWTMTTGTQSVPEMLVTFNQMTQLIDEEDIISCE
jgi:hypothetical protein